MARVGFRRLFWIGAAALLTAAALVSLVALLRGEFTETDGKILGTLAAALGCGGTALVGLALVERRDLVPLGWLVAAVGGVAFVVLAWQVWTEFGGERVALDTLVIVLAVLMLGTARLLHRRLEWLWWLSAGLTVASAAAILTAIHTEPEDGDWAKLLGALVILTALAWFLVPVLGRVQRREADQVVGVGPGRFEVELGEREELVVRPSR